ncbi:MAG TPA: NAD(P)-dependent oxidoreductase [Candidatus Acidoferrales bacterium]|nr:NAD(P)-dependent oxidoreductase [Candidatus Acidoferrales bacterium]
MIGLGVMGGPMAANLVKAGFDVVGHNRSRSPVDRLVEAGGRAAEGVADLARQADVIITVLPDTPDVEGVVLGAEGVLAHARRGSQLIDMSTVDPGLAVQIDAAARERGIRSLDAPVSGGEKGAIDATLAIMVGGDAESFDLARPVLVALGSTVIHVGSAGAGQTVKAANQLLVGGIIELVAEAIVFLESYDVALEPAIEVLSGGLAGSRVLERKARMMVAREFSPSFRAQLHHKDMGIVLRAARQAGVTLPLGALVGQLFTALTTQGGGMLDHSALIRVLDSMSDPR